MNLGHSCQGELKIRMDPESLSGKDVYVQGLTERTVSSMQDFIKLLSLGSRRRTGKCVLAD